MSRWETVTPRLEPHVREPNRDGLDFDLSEADRAMAAEAMAAIRRHVEARNRADLEKAA